MSFCGSAEVTDDGILPRRNRSIIPWKEIKRISLTRKKEDSYILMVFCGSQYVYIPLHRLDDGWRSVQLICQHVQAQGTVAIDDTLLRLCRCMAIIGEGFPWTRFRPEALLLLEYIVDRQGQTKKLDYLPERDRKPVWEFAVIALLMLFASVWFLIDRDWMSVVCGIVAIGMTIYLWTRRYSIVQGSIVSTCPFSQRKLDLAGIEKLVLVRGIMGQRLDIRWIDKRAHVYPEAYYHPYTIVRYIRDHAVHATVDMSVEHVAYGSSLFGAYEPAKLTSFMTGIARTLYARRNEDG